MPPPPFDATFYFEMIELLTFWCLCIYVFICDWFCDPVDVALVDYLLPSIAYSYWLIWFWRPRTPAADPNYPMVFYWLVKLIYP